MDFFLNGFMEIINYISDFNEQLQHNIDFFMGVLKIVGACLVLKALSRCLKCKHYDKCEKRKSVLKKLTSITKQ